MNSKKVSIITTTYNLITKGHKSFFYEMFRSVQEQDYPEIEHIIVDGGSKDGSVDFIKGLINKYGRKEIIFISAPDKGINDATNKGYYRATGDYITLMCDDDFYVTKNAVSKMMNKLTEENADYVYANTWWLNNDVWAGEDITFAWRHPFLINAFIFRKDLLHGEPYLDLNYPMVGDYDLFLRILKQENIKGAKANEVLTVLRPGGYSQSDSSKYIKEIEEILEKHFNSKYINGKELWEQLHQQHPSLLLLLKIKLFCKNNKIKASVKDAFSISEKYKKTRRMIEYTMYFKCYTDGIRPKNRKPKLTKNKDLIFSTEKSREWIETFYEELY